MSKPQKYNVFEYSQTVHIDSVEKNIVLKTTVRFT